VGDNATVSASAHFHNLQLQKSPSRVFGQNSGNSADISKAFFEMGISKFESSQVSQAVRRTAMTNPRRAKGPQTAGISRFGPPSPRSLSQSRGPNRQKSPAHSANIPVLRRPRPETLVRSPLRADGGSRFCALTSGRATFAKKKWRAMSGRAPSCGLIRELYQPYQFISRKLFVGNIGRDLAIWRSRALCFFIVRALETAARLGRHRGRSTGRS